MGIRAHVVFGFTIKDASLPPAFWGSWNKASILLPIPLWHEASFTFDVRARALAMKPCKRHGEEEFRCVRVYRYDAQVYKRVGSEWLSTSNEKLSTFQTQIFGEFHVEVVYQFSSVASYCYS